MERNQLNSEKPENTILKLHLDAHQKETINYQNQMMHYSIYTPQNEAYFFGDIPWHWHKEFEFGYLCNGSILYQTNHKQCILRKGDGIFINSGALHYLHPLDSQENIRLQSQFIDCSFLCGSSSNMIDIKYVTPVLEQKTVEMIPLYHTNPAHAEFLCKMEQAATLGENRNLFFELRLRNLFSELWETIYTWTIFQNNGRDNYNSLEDERLKKILLYIQKYFKEKISIFNIASQIPISERECYRLFQNNLGITPLEYVTSLRLQEAQERLMNSNQSILDIAIETGFGSSSYFGKIFLKYHGISPKEYRNLSRKV